MEKRLSDEILIDLYQNNYTMKEVGILYGYNPASLYRRINKLINERKVEKRSRVGKNRITKYGEEDKLTIKIKNNEISRVITDEDIISFISFGFSYNRISSITGLSVDMIKQIEKGYSKYDNKTNNIDKSYIIELFNNRLSINQIRFITGYSVQSIRATINQAKRAGFINKGLEYIPTIKEKNIMEMYRSFISMDKIAMSNKCTIQELQIIINNLINKNLLDKRGHSTRILNRKRINKGLETDNILRMYNLCISEDIIANYYKVNKDTISKLIKTIDRKDININDKILELIRKRKHVRYISNSLNIPVEVLYEYLRVSVR